MSNNMRQILEEFQNQGEIYHQFVESMAGYVNMVPSKLWMKKDTMKQLLLPPFNTPPLLEAPKITDAEIASTLMKPTDCVNRVVVAGDEWEDKFST